MSDSRAVGELLVERKVLSRDTLEELLAREARSGIPFAELVVDEGGVAERDLVGAVAVHLGLARLEPARQPDSAHGSGHDPRRPGPRLGAVVVGIDDADLIVAMVDPTNAAAIENWPQETGWPIRPAMATTTDIASGPR